MKSTWLIATLIIGLAVFAFAIRTEAQHDEHGHSEAEQEHSAHSMEPKEAGSDKARCSYEGMMMKKSAMVPLEHGEETLYFCNEAQKAAFQKSPKKYLKKLTIGHHHALMNTLTIKEYKDMMQGMGMGMMMKKGSPNDTHWVSAYFIVDGHSIDLPGVTAKVTSPGGKTKFSELKYDKMMKTYTGNLSLLESGKYKVSLLLESSETTLP